VPRDLKAQPVVLSEDLIPPGFAFTSASIVPRGFLPLPRLSGGGQSAIPLLSVSRLPKVRLRSPGLASSMVRLAMTTVASSPPTVAPRATRAIYKNPDDMSFMERARRSDVGRCLSPDADPAWAGRQDAVRNPSPHVAAFNLVQAGQSGCGYTVAATLSRPQEHPAYGSCQRMDFLIAPMIAVSDFNLMPIAGIYHVGRPDSRVVMAPRRGKEAAMSSWANVLPRRAEASLRLGPGLGGARSR